MSKLGQCMVVIALTAAVGGHWALLQSVAWVTMTVNFAQTAPLKEALAKTFGGKNPCEICKMVDAGRKAEKQQPEAQVLTRLDLILVVPSVTFHPPKWHHSFSAFDASGPDRAEAPLLPPPRFG